MTFLWIIGNIFSRFSSGGYIGEALWIGNLGHFFVVLSFLSVLFASIAYFISSKRFPSIENNRWSKAGDSLYLLHGFSVVFIFFLLFWMIFQHKFEYHYAWRHSSTELPLRYMLSCFWEGQEGSFLLWQFWHVSIGVYLIFRLRKWKPPVMSVIGMVQTILATMILGIYFFGYKAGSSPFILLRDVMLDAPVFEKANYLSFIQDGNGLNPLLQNYWMVIHPPVLFLGFASTIVPFAFAFAALWKKDFTGWVNHVISWALFSGGVLSIGILMGGAWAYESLSFGGFWAWDPVENASFVPWLTLIAGLHTLVAFRSSKHGLRISFFFFGITYFFILLSTYLTRSGDLGDTSVHSFTDLGMRAQLLLLLFGATIPFFVVYILRYRKIPEPKHEEKVFTREFWMFVGSLVLLFSAILITYTTCIPVWNKFLTLFGMDTIAPPAEVEAHHNNRQRYIAIVIALLTGSIQFLFYRKDDLKAFLKKISIPTIAAIVITIAVLMTISIAEWQYKILLFAAIYAVSANVFYLLFAIKSQIRLAGGSIAHIGFGLMLIGILISQYKQHVISWNLDGISFGKEISEKEQLENVLLFKGEQKKMGPYLVTYEGFVEESPNIYYKVRYERINETSGEIKESFTLKPNAQINPEMGLVADPSTKHYWNKDIFTHVTSVPDNTNENEETQLHKVAIGDTFYSSRHYIVLKSLELNPDIDTIDYSQGVTAIGVNLEVRGFDNSTDHAQPIYLIDTGNNNSVRFLRDQIESIGLGFTVREINPDEEEISILVDEKDPADDFIIMKAIVFPYINILWLGCLIMFAGFMISTINRKRLIRSA